MEHLVNVASGMIESHHVKCGSCAWGKGLDSLEVRQDICPYLCGLKPVMVSPVYDNLLGITEDDIDRDIAIHNVKVRRMNDINRMPLRYADDYYDNN